MKKTIKKVLVMTAITLLSATASIPAHAGLIRKDVWLGDVNEDGKVTLADAAITLRYALNLQQLDVYETFIADSDGNEKIELNDAKETLRMALNLREKDRMGGGMTERDKNCQIDEGLKVEPKAQWLYFGEEAMEESRLEGFSDYIKQQLVGLNPGPFFEEDVLIEAAGEQPEKEKLRNAVIVGMVPVHTNRMEDIDYNFMIKDNGATLFYVEERNPLNDDKKYYLSSLKRYIVPVSMDVHIIDCYIKQK